MAIWSARDLPEGGAPLTEECLHSVSTATQIGLAEWWAFLDTQTHACGFLPDTRPTLTFDRKVFRRLTSRRYDFAFPDISAFQSMGREWTAAQEYERLNYALQLDHAAALRSASWGIGQVLGEQYRLAGFANIKDLQRAMTRSEDDQLRALARVLEETDLLPALRSRNWSELARLHELSRRPARDYAEQLAKSFARYSSGALPDLTVRAVQLHLTYRGYPVGSIDGIAGDKTIAAIHAFWPNATPAQQSQLDSVLSAAAGAVKAPWGKRIYRSPRAAAGALGTTRLIDAHLVAPSVSAGQVAWLTVTLRSPQSAFRGQYQGPATGVHEDGSPVRVLLETRGFTLLSESPEPLVINPGRDTAPAAFQLRVEEDSQRWLHVILLQDGRLAGELVINDFSALKDSDNRISAQTLQANEADLTLIVRSTEPHAIVSSPRNRANLYYHTLPGIRTPDTPFRLLLRDRLRALYDETAHPADTERELQIVGVELSRCLGPELRDLLRRPDIGTLLLRHDDDFDFPLELCFLEDAAGGFFLGDRTVVCRWYLGVANPPDVISKRIGEVAFLRGNNSAAAPDEALLQRLYPNRTQTFSTLAQVREGVFKARRFDFIQFTGHCKVNDKGLGGLELADGSFIRMIDIGQLMSERAFTQTQPFVLLNACASAQPYIALTDRDSFARRFVAAEVCAFIGTLWPVAGSIANDFATAFHEALKTLTVGAALLAAKRSIVSHSDQTDATAAEALTAIARKIAARSYCLFSHPDLRITV